MYWLFYLEIYVTFVVMEIISLNKKSGVPKYKQIVTSIEDAIVEGILKKGDKLPSLNSIKTEHSLSRDTVLTAFNELKNRGIISSIVGKGYYVMSEDVRISQKIFLLFDELNSFKEDLYNSFLNNLGDNIQVDIFFHHFNLITFNKLISDNVGDYNSYIIMPTNLKNAAAIIEKLPQEKVYILDQIHKDLDPYSAIYQNFEKDIYNGLYKGISSIKKYKKLILLFSKEKQPKGLLDGFNLFCNQNNIEFEVILSLENRIPKKGEVYVVLEDKNLLKIIKKLKAVQLVLAKDIGIISYNDTLLKEVVEGGITTISTDFNLMGKKLAEIIHNDKQLRIENPSNLIIRKSL